MQVRFREIFEQTDDPKRQRSKFLSRMFGIFSERIVDIWSRDPRAPYTNLGRPTLRKSEHERGHTLDFTFKCRRTNFVFVSEMKCEIEYQNFKYFVLRSADQLGHHSKPAFEAFLIAAHSPKQLSISIKSEPIEAKGAILVWGAVDPDTKNDIASQMCFHDILAVEDICKDLAEWGNQEYYQLIKQHKNWSTSLFDGLLAIDSSPSYPPLSAISLTTPKETAP